jgi:putative methionine-R-sulfoxide reductase with GAF domain
MKNNKMKTQQTNMIILTAIIFIFMAGKYFFIPTLLPGSFFMFEFVSATTLLFLLYYADRTIKTLKSKEKLLNDDIQVLNITVQNLKEEIKKKNSISDKGLSTEITNVNIDNIFENLPHVKNSNKFYNNVLSALSENFEIVIALFFTYNEQSQRFSVEGNYGVQKDEPVDPFVIGEGIHGEALNEKKVITLKDLPEEYFVGYSGLGESKPKYLYVLPVADNEKTIGVIEIASFKSLDLEKVWDKVNMKLIELITDR